jgi:hypothetical protein
MSRTSTATGSFRRTRWAAIGVGGVMAVTFFATAGAGAAPAQTAAPAGGISPGEGQAFADTMKIDPRAGNLSIGIDFGKASADHQNSAAQAISQAMDFGTIGTSLAAYGCDGSAPALPQSQQPQPLIADTRTPDQPQQASEDESFAPGFHKSVAVTNDPHAIAVTTTAPFGIATVVEVGGGIATSTSGVETGVRKAAAVTDLSGLTFPGGISLSGLHWEAHYDSDGDPVGTFSIGSATTGPLGKPVQNPNPAATIDKINVALTPFGLHLSTPLTQVDVNHKIVYVDSLVLSVVPNSTRDSVAGALIKGIQPIRQPLFDALLKAKCTTNTEITVSDIAIGSITGAGSFNMVFGGVQAGSGEIAANPFTLGFGSGALGGGVELGPSLGGNNTSSGISAATGTQTAAAAATPAAAGGQTATSPTAAILPAGKGARGGAMAGVGLAGLGLLAAMAEGDRRKMRRAQREIPQFAD